MAATGVAWFAGTLAPGALLYLHRGPLVHLLLAYPGARPARRAGAGCRRRGLRRRRDRAARRAATTLTLLLCARDGGRGRRRVRARERPAAPGARRPHRGARVAVALVLALTALDARAASPRRCAAYEVVLVATAVALLVDLQRGRWSQGAVTGLVVDLGELWEPVTLRDRLARALGDPSLELGYRRRRPATPTRPGGRSRSPRRAASARSPRSTRTASASRCWSTTAPCSRTRSSSRRSRRRRGWR